MKKIAAYLGVLLVVLSFHSCELTNTPVFVDVIFRNDTPEAFLVYAEGMTYEVPANSSLPIEFIENDTITYTASTAGGTLEQTRLGVLVEIGPKTFVAQLDYVESLLVPPTYFHLGIRNSSEAEIQEITTNPEAGQLSLTESVVVPNDGLLYGIGYYYALSGAVVRVSSATNNQGQSREYREGGQEFTFSNALNQTVILEHTSFGDDNGGTGGGNVDARKKSTQVYHKLP